MFTAGVCTPCEFLVAALEWSVQTLRIQEKMTPLVKCLPHSHEDLSLDLQHPCKRQCGGG